MFNIFPRKTAKDFMEQAQETYKVPESKPAKDDCLYTVGTTQSGQTVLKIGDGYSTMTLTMNDAAVRQMIRLLEATLEEVEDDVATVS